MSREVRANVPSRCTGQVRSGSRSTRSMRAHSAGAFRPTLKSAATDGWPTLMRVVSKVDVTEPFASRYLDSWCSRHLRRQRIWNASSLLPCDDVVSRPSSRTDHTKERKTYTCVSQFRYLALMSFFASGWKTFFAVARRA